MALTLTPADIATVSRLLDEVLDLPPAAREAWLDALPANQRQHAAMLREMLAEQARLETAGPFGQMPSLRTAEAVADVGDVSARTGFCARSGGAAWAASGWPNVPTPASSGRWP